MKTTSNIDFRTRAARSATLDYCRKADLFALAAKAGSTTHFLLYESEELIQQMKAGNARCCLREDRGKLRWKGLVRTNMSKVGWKVGKHKYVEIRKPWKTFEVGDNGTMSKAQEQAVVDELNRLNFLGRQWRRCADEQWEGGYTPDIVSLDNEITIEVKGFGGTFSSLKWGE